MTEEEKANALWARIVSVLGKGPKEFETVRLNGGNGVWFLVSVEDNVIFVRNAAEHRPSARIAGTRFISEDEFTRVYPFYEKWRTGRCKRYEIRDVSMNTSYIFALIAHFNNGSP
jgi:hypothetical protein